MPKRKNVGGLLKLKPIFGLILIGLLASGSGCAQNKRQNASTSKLPTEVEASIAAMPQANQSKVIPGNQCIDQPIKFVSDVDKYKSGWLLPAYDVRLRHWTIRYYGPRAGSRDQRGCFDGEFAVKAWQAALGHQDTGVLTKDEAAYLVDIVDNHEKSFIEAKRNLVIYEPREEDVAILKKAKDATKSNKFDVAFPLFKVLAERGNPHAQYWLGKYYLNGWFVENNQREALRWIGKSAQAGDPGALAVLSECYLGGCGLKRDYNEAKKYAELAAAQKHPAGYYALARHNGLTRGGPTP